MNEISEDTLLREADHLHRIFFGGPVPPQIAERYVQANWKCFPAVDQRSAERIARIVDARLDAEAVELVLRVRRRDSVLTRKIQILFYLAEVRAAYYSKFVNEQPGLPHAAAALAGSVLKTGYLYAKGLFLIWRHRLA